uniref:Radical SAM core domain-containing protein n=1 Tax=Chromera velia CCMP2878 TaxID=1169474 RepID=A0A0G4HPG4_9ALVE|eukprot:Cvel_7746.t1-p1 / transcript=Cvel_7746.t1 / gene=Cvel_7746 / organism=Chromera_velia_CCMP2878 / gene_product=Probable dual-specificity RNA methyltransferase, putative / transcript_product=Probable dual-specificity RNA methyltransferase, putative / location=Cvel_scaffold412:57233-60812(-) / protein_length=513 / sequence_SO=supercontig / SO=protein_coding / is_pseudo=false
MTDSAVEWDEAAKKKTGKSANQRRSAMTKVSVFDEAYVLEEFRKRGLKEAHAFTLWRYLIQHRLSLEELDEVPNVSKKAVQMFQEELTVTSKVLDRQVSADKSAVKLLIQLHDDRKIESVIMRYGAVQLASFPEELRGQRKEEVRESVDEDEIGEGQEEEEGECGDDKGSVTTSSKGPREFKSNRRATVCVSSQVGCQMGCTFCATGTMGLVANLTAGEILEQLYHANNVEQIRNVVFMGMGEPLDNYEEVVGAIRGMTDVRRFQLAASRISVSTVGVVPKLRKLAHDAPGCSLALSLHAPTQDLRTSIVPSARAWSLEKILEASDYFVRIQKSKVKRRGGKPQFVLVEYVLIADVNDSDETAHELGKLLAERADSVMLNVIPYNPTDVPHDYKPPSQARLNRFLDLVRTHGVRTVVRQELGQDVAAACGQLVVSREKQQEGERERPSQQPGVVQGAEGSAAGGSDNIVNGLRLDLSPLLRSCADPVTAVSAISISLAAVCAVAVAYSRWRRK